MGVDGWTTDGERVLDTARFGDTGIADRTHPPAGGATPPQIRFVVDDDRANRMTASPPGAFIECFCTEDPEVSVVRIRTASHKHIADIRVHTGTHVGAESLTDETIAIASAIYWSWWRACDMRGEAPKEMDHVR